MQNRESVKKKKNDLNNFSKLIKNQLKKNHSLLNEFILKISEGERVKLITAFLTHDIDLIKKMLLAVFSEIFKEENIKLSPDKAMDIFAYDAFDLTNLVNDAALLIIQHILNPPILDNIQLMDYRIRIMNSVMQNIPEVHISITAKKHICEIIDPSMARSSNLHLAYLDVFPMLEQSRSSGDITKQEYHTAINKKNLNQSDFIFLSLGYLQKDAKEEHLNQIRHFYLMGQYDEAILKIKELIANDKNFVGEEILNVLENKSQFSEIDPMAHHSRHFFENRLSQLYFGNMDCLEQINKITMKLIGASAKTPHEAIKNILNLSESNNQEVRARYKELCNESKLLAIRDRKTVSDNVYSRNPGILRSSAPLYPDEISEYEMQNRVVDRSRLSESKGYSHHHKNVAYVGSISMHTYFVVAMLEKYYKENSSDPQIIADINEYIKAHAFAYISHGYHSFMEVIDVFRDPLIESIFSKDGSCFLNISLPSALLQAASRDTQEYTKMLCFKNLLHHQVNMFYQRGGNLQHHDATPEKDYNNEEKKRPR